MRAEAIKRFGLATSDALVLTPRANDRDMERQHAFLRSLFPEQLAFVLDPSKRKAAQCGRRSGKTVGLIFLGLKAQREYPGCTIPYIALDRESAKRLFWRPLKQIDKQFGFGLRFNETHLHATAPNGSVIWLIGAKDEDDIEKLRGDRYPLVMVDESASFKSHIEALVEEVVEPALEDLDGTLVLVGTPGRVPAGLFYQVTNGLKPGWSTHRWTVLQNSRFPRWNDSPAWQQDAVKWLEALRRRKNWSVDDPIYRREWLGEWVEDRESTVYRFQRERNTFVQLPESRDWLNVMGIDFGYNDPTAFSIGTFSPTQMDYYVLETWEKKEMLADDVAARVRQYEEKYGEFIRKVGDSSGKQFFTELNQRKGLNIHTAERKAKLDFIEHMNSDFLQGRIKVRHGDPLCDDYQRLIWNADRTGEHERRPNHRADSTLYAWRESRHWAGKLEEPGPAAGSNEAIDAVMQAYLQRAMVEEEAMQRQRLEDAATMEEHLW